MLDLSNLPCVDSATARIHQALLALPAGLPLPVDGAEVQLTWHASRGLPATAVSLSCETAQGSCVLCVEAGLVDRLADVTLPGWREESASALPVAWRLTVVLDALLRATSLGAGRLRVQLAPGRTDPTFAALGGTLTVDGASGSFLLSGLQCAPDLIEGLASAVRAPALPDARLRFPALCRLGQLTLALGRLRTLDAGDVLLLPQTEGPGVETALLLADGSQWRGLLRDDGSFEAIARQERSQAVTEMTHDLLMSDEDDLPLSPGGFDPEDAGLEDLGTVADLPVVLDLQFHRSLVPLAEFSRLTEGSFLDLGIDLGQPVRIRANDCTVGSGHLVQIGDRVGVRIERWRFARINRPG